MIYFDNAATAFTRPPQVGEAMAAALSSFGPARLGAHGPAEEALRCLARSRKVVASLVGCADPARVSFFSGATQALNTVLYALDGHVVTTAAAHQDILRPLHRRGHYAVAALDEKGRLDVVKLGAVIQEDTTAIVLPHAEGTTGAACDLPEVAGFCKRRGLRLIVDASQSAGLLPIRLDEWGISALCFSGHRALLGPPGVGGLVLGEDFAPDPTIIGGDSTGAPSLDFPAAGPERYEPGTLNMPGIAGLAAGIEYLHAEGDVLRKRADTLARRFARRVSRIRGVEIYGDIQARDRLPIIALTVPGMDCEALASALWTRYEIVIASGLHGTPLLHESLGTADTGVARFSFSGFNTPEEVDATASAIVALTGGGHRRGRLL